MPPAPAPHATGERGLARRCVAADTRTPVREPERHPCRARPATGSSAHACPQRAQPSAGHRRRSSPPLDRQATGPPPAQRQGPHTATAPPRCVNSGEGGEGGGACRVVQPNSAPPLCTQGPMPPDDVPDQGGLMGPVCWGSAGSAEGSGAHLPDFGQVQRQDRAEHGLQTALLAVPSPQ